MSIASHANLQSGDTKQSFMLHTGLQHLKHALSVRMVSVHSIWSAVEAHEDVCCALLCMAATTGAVGKQDSMQLLPAATGRSLGAAEALGSAVGGNFQG